MKILHFLILPLTLVCLACADGDEIDFSECPMSQANSASTPTGAAFIASCAELRSHSSSVELESIQVGEEANDLVTVAVTGIEEACAVCPREVRATYLISKDGKGEWKLESTLMSFHETVESVERRHKEARGKIEGLLKRQLKAVTDSDAEAWYKLLAPERQEVCSLEEFEQELSEIVGDSLLGEWVRFGGEMEVEFSGEDDQDAKAEFNFSIGEVLPINHGTFYYHFTAGKWYADTSCQ